jgi:APA family basic amino acid/polyamine antiporter
MREENNETEFKRSLGLLDATMIVMGSMIGSGVFIVSADIARTVGSPILLLAVWLLTGLLTMIAALSYGELSGMMPKAGGQYVYLREAFNKPIAFLYGWTLFTVIQTGTIAAVAVGFGKFTAYWIPALSEKNILYKITLTSSYNFSISAAQLFAIASIIILTLINLRGVSTGKTVQTFFTIIKVLAIAGLIVAGGISIIHHNYFTRNFQQAFYSFTTTVTNGNIEVVKLAGVAIVSSVAVSMVGSLFSSDAWNNITFIAGEVKDPSRNIPRSLFLGTLGVTLIYIVVNIVYLGLLPLTGLPDGKTVEMRGIQFAESDRVGIAAAEMIFGTLGALIMASLTMLSTFACNNGLILSGARVYYAMAKDDLFFKRAATLNKNSVPAFALIIQCIWACILCLSGTYGNLLDYVVFSVLIFYILTIYGVIRLRSTQPIADRPYRAIAYPYMQYLYILLATAICIFLLIYKSEYTWPGLIIVLLGIPVYYLSKIKNTNQ